jgi:hypothetical protein
MSDEKLKVFISYASPNKLFAINLYNQLIDSQIDAWIDKKKIEGGENFPIAIKMEMRQSDAVIIIFSNESIKRETFYQTEIKFALELNNEKPENTNFIIPINLDNCKLPEGFHDINYIVPEKSESAAVINALIKRAEFIGKSIEIDNVKLYSEKEILENIMENDCVIKMKTGMMRCMKARENIKNIYINLNLINFFNNYSNWGDLAQTLTVLCLEYDMMKDLFHQLYQLESLPNGAISISYIALLEIWASCTIDYNKKEEIRLFLYFIMSKTSLPSCINQINSLLLSLQGNI